MNDNIDRKNLQIFFEKNCYMQQMGEFYSRTYILDALKYPELRKKHFYISPRNKFDFVSDTERLLDNLIEHLMLVIQFSCASEFRHFGGYAYGDLEAVKDTRKELVSEFPELVWSFQSAELNTNKYIVQKGRRSRAQSYEDIQHAFKNDMYRAMKMMGRAFREFVWDDAYGGQKWADGVDGWFRLFNAQTLSEKIIAIDHAYDLQHNTGVLFNKHPIYENQSGKVANFLNHKRYARSLREIYQRCTWSNKYASQYHIFLRPRYFRSIRRMEYSMGL